MKKLAVILFAIVCFTSCEEQMIMIPEQTTFDTERVVLVEELTGTNCPNCPTGAAIAAELLLVYPGQVVVIGVHGDFLSEPITGSQYDFRFEKAKDLENYLKPWFGKPAAAVNRTEFEGQSEFSNSLPALWPSLVEQELAKDHVLNVVAEIEYDSATREYSINMAAIPLIDLEGDYNVTVFITENDIVDAQKDQGEIIEDYKFKHVLRDIITPFDGTSLTSNPSAGSVANKSFTGVLPAEDGTWIAENIDIVIAVHRIDAGYKEVVQAFEKHLVE